jgi:DNA polymerase-3 subunit gamma/tau
VDEGRAVDMLEIDAASNTGVDNVRELIDNAQYSPSRGRYKVYLIDEVHMLSKGAFNALLKTLEEPPSHVKFILATTDPQKLPVTVLSRCLQFNLKRLTLAAIREQLSLVLKNEGIAFETGAVAEIARAADGSMRDGLSLLDQAIAFAGGGELKRAPIEDMLGTTGRNTLFGILNALADADTDALLDCIQKLDAQAPDYSALLNDLAAQLQRLSVLQLLPKAQTDDDEPALLALKDRIAVEDVQLYYQIAVLGRRDMPWAPDPRLGFEMTLLRMLAFRPEEGGVPARAASPAASVSKSSAPVAASAAVQKLPADTPWSERVEAMTLDVLSKQLARHSAWQGREGQQIRLLLDPKTKHLLQDERRLNIERALSAQLGESIQLTIEVAAVAAIASPAQQDQQRADDRQKSAETAIDNDATVRAFKDVFGATLKPGSVQPRE